jgi:uncharacterized protein YllA (UPF0747 family)
MNAEMKALMEDESAAYAEFEKILNRRRAEISEEWNRQLQAADGQINACQKELHMIIHSKESLAQSNKAILLDQNRFLGIEHQRISRAYKEKIIARTDSIQQLTATLSNLQDEILRGRRKLGLFEED